MEQQPIAPNERPTPASPQAPNPRNRQKKVIIGLIIAIVIIIAGGAVFTLLPRGADKAKEAPTKKTIPTEFTMSADNTPVEYAGHKVYDACNFVPISIVKQHLKNYGKELAHLGEGQAAEKPFTLIHSYYDENHPKVRGDDSKPRAIAPNETDSQGKLTPFAFKTYANSNCAYEQGLTQRKVFLDVFMTQPPVAVSSELTAYLAELKQAGKVSKQTQDIEVYGPVPVETGESIAIVKRNDTIVFLSTALPELLSAATDETVKKLSAPATGPMTASYPKPYNKLVNACRLFTAEDFKKHTGKDADPLVYEFLMLVEAEENIIQRNCIRYDVKNSRKNVSGVKISLRESKDSASAEKYMANLKTKAQGGATVTPVSKSGYGDESYIKKDPSGTRLFTLFIRSGTTIVELSYEDVDFDYTSEQDFETHLLPIAKTVLERLKAAQE